MSEHNEISRRKFLQTAAVAPFAASAIAAMQKNVPVGLELYSVRDELIKDLPGTVTAVAKMGYQVVEFYSPYLEWTPQAAKDVRKLLDDLGIQCRSTHNGPPSFTPDGLKKATELNQIIGSKTIIMASAGKVVDLAGWEKVAAQLAAAAEQLRPLGMSTGYHNHQSSGSRWKASGRWTCSPRARRRTSCCSSTSARASRWAKTRSRGSRRTPDASKASTARTGEG